MSEKSNTRDMKDTKRDGWTCSCGGNIIWFTSDNDICQKCSTVYPPLSHTDEVINLKAQLSSRDSEIAKLTSEQDEAVKLLRSIIELDESYLESGKAFDDIKSFLSKTPKP